MKTIKIIACTLTCFFITQVFAQTSLATLTPVEITQTQAQYIAQFNNAEQATPINKELTYVDRAPETAILNYSIFVPANNLTDVQLFIPNPPTLDRQTVTTNLVTYPASQPIVISDLSKLHHPIYAADFSTIQHPMGFNAILTIKAVLKKIQLINIPAGQPAPIVKPLSDEERKLTLRVTTEFDYNRPAFKQWLDANNLHPFTNETRLDFAKRVFLFIQDNFQYYYDIDWDRSATNTIATGKTDCGGFSILFSSIMRYHGIPARAVIGRWAYTGEPDYPYQSHVKAEFYLDNIGWVPLDVTSGLISHHHPQDLTYFAKDPGDFITFYVDPGIFLNTMYGKYYMPFLQDFVYWVKSNGNYADSFLETWTVTSH